MCSMGGQIQNQPNHFARVSTPAKTLEAITAECEADPALQLVDPAEPDEGFAAADDVACFKALLVHHKIAALFAQGPAIRQAVHLVRDLCDSLSDEDQERAELLVNLFVWRLLPMATPTMSALSCTPIGPALITLPLTIWKGTALS